ncbi:hypothetical protein HVS_04220 [Acetivibrio saccincola]|uniref:Uncharacterized protein n=1 Tax=Acetivibrio saccincola TaxID=1677857 RepID=A0A2K9E5P3_9FIRM|nr:hypothetical protein HVS_04220 [Acetivibrio saccincola]
MRSGRLEIRGWKLEVKSWCNVLFISVKYNIEAFNIEAFIASLHIILKFFMEVYV